MVNVINVDSVGSVMKRWVKNEDGFQMFEKLGITQIGVLLALGVGAVVIFVVSNLWDGVAANMGTELNNLTPDSVRNDNRDGWIR